MARTVDESRLGGVGALLFAATMSMPSPTAAQQPLVGVITDHHTAAPLAGVYVALEVQDGGHAVSAALSDASGRFVLSAEPGSVYRIRAERVGLETYTTEWFTAQAGAAVRRIAMSDSPVQLDGLTVRAEVRTCQLDPGEGTVVQRWWDEVRKALETTAFVEANELVDLRFIRYERAWSANLRALRHERDLPVDSALRKPFLAQSASRLSEEGFIQGWEGQRRYLAPDAAVLFSEAFLGDHCLGIASAEDNELVDAPAGPRQLRLAVTPTREDHADIRGVLTVDTVSGELRSFDFAYTNLPADLPRSAAGGHLSFAYLPTGAWIVSDWWIRMPQVEYLHGEGSRIAAVPVVRGYIDAGGRAVDADGELFETAQRSVGTLRGVVHDSLGARPLAGARVSVVGSRLAVRADSAGRFEIARVPAGRVGVTFHDQTLVQIGLPSPVFLVDVHEGAVDTVALATPGFAATSQLLCPDRSGLPSTILTGRILDAGEGRPIGGAGVRAHWVAGERDRTMNTEGTAGGDGRYVLCDLPTGQTVSLAVRTDSTWHESTSLELREDRVLVTDLRPGGEALAWLRGTVRFVEEGTAIPGADVHVLSIRGDTVAEARTDTAGGFTMRVPPDVGYRAVASGEGYLREASAPFSLDGAESLDVAFDLVSDPGSLAMKLEGLKVEVEARQREVARYLLRPFGQSEASLGRRWIDRATLAAIPSTGDWDVGVAIMKQSLPGVWVDQGVKYQERPVLCVQQVQGRGRCSIILLDGVVLDLFTALLLDFRDMEGIAVLPPNEATTFFGTAGGNGAVLLWTKTGGR